MRHASCFRLLLMVIVLLAGAQAGAQTGQRCVLMVDRFQDPADLPQFNPVFDQGVLADGLLEFDIDTSSPSDQAGLNFTLLKAPANMSIDSAMGVVTWTPDVLQVGTIAATVAVVDPQGRRNRHTFCIEVIDGSGAPLITPLADQTALVDTSFSLPVEASDPDPGDTLAYTLDQAPGGMTIDPQDGLIDWMPAAVDLGSSTVVVRVSDSTGRADTAMFEITVADDNQPPVIQPLADRGSRPGIALTMQVIASDADSVDLIYSLTERPSGMTIEQSTGLIAWTPTFQQLGVHEVGVRVADSLGFADQTGLQVFVDTNRPPVAVDDTGYRVERGDTLVVTAPGVLANDIDPNDDLLSAQFASGPSRGTLALNADGGFEYTPDNPTGTVGFVEKWSFDVSNGANLWLPIVVNLDDDPASEILVGESNGCCGARIIALDGVTGTVDWERNFPNREIATAAEPAVGDIDLDGRPEIILVGGINQQSVIMGYMLIALEADGSIKWVSEPAPYWFREEATNTVVASRHFDGAAITLADLDGDGTPEIIAAIDNGPVGYQVWDNQGRRLQRVFEPGTSLGGASSRVEVVDLDLDGDPEIVVGTVAWHHDGMLYWSLSGGGLSSGDEANFPIVANLDDDPFPELVRTRGGISAPGNVMAINHDGSLLWEIPRSTDFDTSPITAADVNADGYADVLRTHSSGVDLFEALDGRDGSVVWSKNVPTRGAGATVMDMDRDGFVEVVLFDAESNLHVWDGRDGTEKLVFDTDGPATTIPPNHTIPVFADIDVDGQAELVTSMGFTFGTSPVVSVWQSPNGDWPPMRSIWNQQRYHVTNINDDLTVPARERTHWLLPGLNQAQINERLPEDRTEESDSFGYRASDGELQSNTGTVGITILPPNSAPRILSTPRTLASPGFEYAYRALAVDADAGEILVWSLPQAPAAMVIDSDGALRWTPGSGDLGSHPIVVEVTDSIGVSGFQQFVIDVVAPVIVPDLAGFGEAVAVGALASVALVADPLREVFSNSVAVGQVAGQDPAAGTTAPAGGSVAVDISIGPVPVQVPLLLGLRELEAINAVVSAGLSVGNVTYANSDYVPAGGVLAQEPTPGSLAAPGLAVDLQISGGSRAVIALEQAVIPAGSSSTVSVSVRDVDGTPIEPQPVISLSLDVPAGGVTGAAPTLVGSTIQTDAGAQGAFGVVASFGSETVTREAVIFQAPSDGTGADIYTEFVGQLEAFKQLIAQLLAAVEAGDAATIESVDLALGDLLGAVDSARLRSISPIAPDGGVPPSAQTAADAGFGPGPDDSAYTGVSAELVTLLEQLELVVAEGTAPDAVVAALNQDLAATASSLAGLEPGVYGVLKARGSLIAILGTRVPRLLEADIRAVRLALRDTGIITDTGVSVSGRFSLPGIMAASSIRQSIISDFYVPYLGDVARAMGTIIAADLLESYVNGGAIVGVVTGGSLAIHVFEIPNSVIEGFGFDPADPANNQVTIVGPELIDSVMDALGDLPSAEDFKDLNSIMDSVQTQIDNANVVGEAWDEANSLPSQVLQGCILDGFPTCRQLVYPGGIASVYKIDSGLSLPAPVAIVVRNLDGGGMAVHVANFVPTQEE